MSYFVQLSETNTTLNLEQITSVEWNWVCEELQNTIYTTTVNLCSGTGYYITENDARTLWRALQRYNQSVQNSTSQATSQQKPVSYEREQARSDDGRHATSNPRQSSSDPNPIGS